LRQTTLKVKMSGGLIMENNLPEWNNTEGQNFNLNQQHTSGYIQQVGVCPTCHRCPTCGQPSNYWYPWWRYQPNIVGCSTTGSNTIQGGTLTC